MSRLLRLAVFAVVLTVVQPFSCVFDSDPPDASGTDPCLVLLGKARSPVYSSEDSYWDTLVLIALKNSDNNYVVQGFGVAIAKDYFLTGVSAKFFKFSDEDLYIISNRASVVHPLKTANIYPDVFIGHYNLSAWQDLVLIKLSNETNFGFSKFMGVSGNNATELLKDKLRVSYKIDERLQLLNSDFKEAKLCTDMFAQDVVQFDPLYMGCSSDNNAKDKDFLRGSPISQLFSYESQGAHNKDLLIGIHSLDSLTHPGYMITYVAPHCDWLASVSNRTLKCEVQISTMLRNK